MEEDTLYVIKDLGEKEKVSSDVVSLLVNNENGGCIYYTKDAAEKQMASDLVDDDCAATDKALKEPNYDDPKYKIEKVEKSSWTGKYEKVEEVDQDKYDADWEAYRARDETR